MEKKNLNVKSVEISAHCPSSPADSFLVPTDVPLQHLTLIYELLQQFYRYSLRDEKEKIRLKRKEKVLVETPLYIDFCETEEKHR